ncbi:MAG: putative 2OG-Fe(II) oxygenase [Thioalkalispiraceae bacterium]|jgi:hypothetical protein
MQDFPREKIYNVVCHECKPLHTAIVKDILQLLDDPAVCKSHFFNGRYENIYISEAQIPSVKPVLQLILQEAANLLGTSEDKLKLGFWFNFMQKNDVTIPHRHDDDDELISGTYYLQMPEGSGMLKIKLDQYNCETIQPQEAALTCFHPSVEHEVTNHGSPVPRISIGFNIGPQDAISD